MNKNLLHKRWNFQRNNVLHTEHALRDGEYFKNMGHKNKLFYEQYITLYFLNVN